MPYTSIMDLMGRKGRPKLSKRECRAVTLLSFLITYGKLRYNIKRGEREFYPKHYTAHFFIAGGGSHSVLFPSYKLLTESDSICVPFLDPYH